MKKIILILTMFLLLSCNDGIKQKVSHKEVGDELHYTVTTTWTDSCGDHTITESYLDRDTAYNDVKPKQLKVAKKMREQNNEQSSIH